MCQLKSASPLIHLPDWQVLKLYSGRFRCNTISTSMLASAIHADIMNVHMKLILSRSTHQCTAVHTPMQACQSCTRETIQHNSYIRPHSNITELASQLDTHMDGQCDRNSVHQGEVVSFPDLVDGKFLVSCTTSHTVLECEVPYCTEHIQNVFTN